MTVMLWMVSSGRHYAEAKKKGADRVTTDYPNRLSSAIARPQKR